MRPDLPERIPGKPANEHEQDDCTGPVREPGEGARDHLTDVLQADCEALLPVRQWGHRAVCQSNPQHASPDEREQEPAGQVRCGQRALQGAEPPGERAWSEEAAHSPAKALPEECNGEQRGDHPEHVGDAKSERQHELAMPENRPSE